MAKETWLQRDWSIGPGDVLQRLLEDRGLRQADLAERTDLSAKHINQIVKNKAGLSGDVAIALERALGTPAQFWTRLAADFEAHESRARSKERLAAYSSWASAFNGDCLVAQRIVNREDSPSTRVDKLLTFFGVASPDAFEETYIRPRVSFRRSQSFAVAEQDTALWLRLVELKSDQLALEPLNFSRLRKVARKLPSLSTLPLVDGFVAARALLAGAGVALVFVPEVPRTRVCAATWWFGSERPVIGITERHRRLDTLWFNLMHEVGHVLLHPRRTTFLDLDEAMKSDDGAELEANEFARDMLLGDARDAVFGASGRQEIALLAAELGVHVSIVAGQYAFERNAYPAMSALRSSMSDRDVVELAAA